MRKFLLFAGLLFSATIAQAQGRLNTWVGNANAQTSNFLSPGNWTFLPASGDILYINNASVRITATQNLTLTNLEIRLGTPGSQGFTLGISNTSSPVYFNITSSSSYNLQAGGVIFVAGTNNGNDRAFRINGVTKIGNFNINQDVAFTGPASASALTPGATATTPTSGFVFGALPVVLVSFDAIKQQNGVAISWKTQQESNTSFFAIEKSTDGFTYQEIGRVAASGTSSVPRTYAYTDNSTNKGIAYYRVRLEDLNGKYGYTTVKAVRASSSATRLGLYPNPAVTITNLVIDNPEQLAFGVNVFNRNGQLVARKNATAGASVLPLDLSSFPAGDYMIDVQFSNGSRLSSKLIVARH